MPNKTPPPPKIISSLQLPPDVVGGMSEVEHLYERYNLIEFCKSSNWCPDIDDEETFDATASKVDSLDGMDRRVAGDLLTEMAQSTNEANIIACEQLNEASDFLTRYSKQDPANVRKMLMQQEEEFNAIRKLYMDETIHKNFTDMGSLKEQYQHYFVNQKGFFEGVTTKIKDLTGIDVTKPGSIFSVMMKKFKNLMPGGDGNYVSKRESERAREIYGPDAAIKRVGQFGAMVAVSKVIPILGSPAAMLTSTVFLLPMVGVGLVLSRISPIPIPIIGSKAHIDPIKAQGTYFRFIVKDQDFQSGVTPDIRNSFAKVNEVPENEQKVSMEKQHENPLSFAERSAQKSLKGGSAKER